jgi:membrane-anchored protein YejM (alkaline phosphatase superfamily)
VDLLVISEDMEIGVSAKLIRGHKRVESWLRRIVIEPDAHSFRVYKLHVSFQLCSLVVHTEEYLWVDVEQVAPLARAALFF